MNFSIFENDDSLGAVAYETARFSGSYVGAMGSDGSAQRDQINANGWGVTAWSSVAAGGFTNVRNYTVSIRAECGANKNVIAAGIKASIEDTNALNATCRFVASSGCPSGPDLVGGGSVFTPKVTTPKTTVIKGGQLATVDVPISFDDVTDKAGFAGWSTTTWVLIAVAGVLVLKRI